MSLWGKTDLKANRPKFIPVDEATGVVTSGPYVGKKLVFIDEVEATRESNKSKGVTGTGWYVINDQAGRTRAELLVAISDAIRVDEDLNILDESEPVETAAGIDTED